ncbi:hypothetical protein O181_035721 [Austropuccinia psidii MF-1]|uniref:Uncharacterized protein n=1 Tax=Austropuccinia psidii MF-1 TaxID=1389203 RepID=A0A9Q3D348_9BASI|nr:hypothetical protein [Austropuccinia psidii MF-1]
MALCYASNTALTRLLPSLRLWSAFLTCLQCTFPSLRLYSALPTCLRRRLLSLCLFSALLTCLQHPPHTGLILNPAYDPYAPAAPYFRTPAAYHPYAPPVPSRYASNTTLNPPYA